MAKKSLADQLSELYNSTPGDYDIEDAERGLFQHKEPGEDGNSSDENDDDTLRSQHYLQVGKSKLRGEQGLKLKGERYKGKASSRSEIFGERDHEISQEEEESEEQDDEEENDESHDESEQGVAEELEHEEIDGNLDSDDQEESEEDDDEESEDEETTANDKRSKLKQLMANERKLIINRLSTSTQTDALKGYAVVNQQQTFDKIIDIRMKLQKSVTNSNLLPLNNETFEEFIEEEDTTSKKLQDTEALLHTLLDNIIALRTTTYNNGQLTKEPLEYIKSKKRTFEEFAEETSKLDKILSKTRDNVLTKWSHKVDSASGASALQGNKFKALNSNAAQQVEMNLMDMDRLVKRTRVNRRDVKPLGYVDEDEENGDEEEDQQEKKHIDRALKEREDIFDDEDFYRVLLNDLVDRKISSSNPTSGLTIQLTKTKFKKKVDTKASKGRKLRYTVQEKLVNWEAPRGGFKWNDEQIDEFCAGLLGQKVNFDEEDEDVHDSEEDENLKNDDLRIFG